MARFLVILFGGNGIDLHVIKTCTDKKQYNYFMVNVFIVTYLADMLVFRGGSGRDGRRVVVVGLLVVVRLVPGLQGSLLQSLDSSREPRHLRPPRVACRRIALNLDC